ncbi:MAG: hypothetical protein DRI33_04640 [Caldiserica bacterium]|nr:MAG: hypothetical protein DRI33_04640 [Caldisericota bacterium]
MKTVNNKILAVIFSALAIFALSGCGSSGTQSDDQLVGGTLPVANAGQDLHIVTGELSTLDGSASSDANGDTLSYTWTIDSQPSGGNAVLLDDTSVKPTFVPNVHGPYVFSLTVNDGTVDSAADTVTMTAGPLTKFIITVQTDNNGSSSDTEYRIPVEDTDPTLSYLYNVDCNNDGTDEATDLTGAYVCSYNAPGTYTIVISYDHLDGFPAIYAASGSANGGNDDAKKFISVVQWGIGEWATMADAFSGCTNLEKVSTKDKPDLSKLTDLGGMFAFTASFNSDVSNWDVSSVTNMSEMFYDAFSFDWDISSWDVSSVTQMFSMFENAILFDQNISSWIVINVTDHADFDTGTIPSWEASEKPKFPTP